MKNEATNAPDTEGRAPMADDGQVSGSGRRIARALSGRAGYALLLSLGAGRAAKSVNRAPARPKGLRKTFEYRPAPIVDAGRAHLRAVGERLQQIGQLGVAVPFHEARHIIGLATAARLADDRQRRVSHVGQGERAVA